jgi:4-amino-4-deoxy-L-arabinose transferase-like glycosyltransferase
VALPAAAPAPCSTVLAAHLVVWTVLPILTCPNLQLDLAEDLALGKEWQLGYWKHPPLPWWLADLSYRVTGSVNALYVLGPLAAVACFYAVYKLAREVTDPLSALIAVLMLEGMHYYNFSVVKFAHDQVQLPFWAFTGLFFYRALRHGRIIDWALAGAFLAGAFWSKYAAFALAATLGLFLLFDPVARRAWRTSGPYVMGWRSRS